VPKSLLRSKRAVAMAVVATVVGVSAGVLLSGQSTSARAAAAPGSTVRASVVNGTNAQSPRGGDEQELSSDGTTVAFASYAQLDDIKTADRENVYIRNLRDNKTVLISRGQFIRPEPEPTPDPTPGPIGLASDPLLSLNGRRTQPPPLQYGETTPTGSSRQPTISADGRYVAFVTRADNIVPADDDTDPDILVCDRDPDADGVFDEPRAAGGGLDFVYRRVNQPQYLQGEGGAYRVDFPSSPKLSDDASRIVWEDTFVDANNQYHDVVRTSLLRAPAGGTLGTHAAAPGAVQIVDTPLGELAPVAQYSPDVSSDGRFVVLVGHYERPESDGEFYYYVPFHAVIRKDMGSGAVLRVDWDVITAEAATYLSEDQTVELAAPAISGNGGEVAFEAEEYHDSCGDGCWNSVANQPMVFVVRIGPNDAPIDSIVASRDNAGEIVNGIRPGLSGDGRFLAFGTDNLNTHDGVDVPASDDDNCVIDTSDLHGKPLVNLSGLPPTSEGRDERTVCQVVVRDLVVDRDRLRNEAPRVPGTLASAGTGTDCADEVPDGGTCGGDDDSPPFRATAPSLSHNGSTVAFDSRATNLVPDQVDDNDYTDVFVRTFRPELRADPTPLEFGEVAVGDTFDQVVRFDHVGTGPLVITDIRVDGSSEFAIGAQTCSGEAVVLQQTGSCEVSVTFAPKVGADRTGTLRLTLRDGRQFTVPLRGTGSQDQVRPDRARFAAGPDPLAFGDRLLLSDGPTQTVTVTNTGGSNLTITSAAVVSAVAPTDYTISADTCTGATLPQDGTCQVTVTFSPTAPGDRPAVLRFVDNSVGGAAHLIGMTGKGSTPTLQLSPAVTQSGRVVTVSGAGFAPNHPVTITISGSIESAKAFTDETGAFTQGLLILPKSAIGNRPVAATIDGTTLEAEKPLLIVPPSSSPGDFVARG
jgi:hypothetical protein